LRKISYTGTGLDARAKVDIVESGPNAGNPSTAWSSRVISSATDGFYGKKAAIDIFSRKELYLIVKVLEDASYLIRSCDTENEAMLIADMISMTVCSSFDSKNIDRICKSLMKSRI